MQVNLSPSTATSENCLRGARFKRRIVLAMAGLLVWGLSACTIVPIEVIEAQQQSETFDPVAYVDSVWQSQVIPTVTERAVDLPTVLHAIEADLEAGGQEQGLFVGGAYHFMVKGRGTVTKVLTESRNGTAVIQVDGYDGPAEISLQIGPLIRGNSVRDAVGLIKFGLFKEQTEFGQVAKELNKRVASDVIGDQDLTTLQGKLVAFDGAFSVSTTNQTNIDLSEITITPVTLEISE